jgi:hypothetical protein
MMSNPRELAVLSVGPGACLRSVAKIAYIRPWQRRQTIMFLPFKRISDHFPGAGRSAATAAPWESSLEPADINLELQRSLPVRMRWSVF